MSHTNSSSEASRFKDRMETNGRNGRTDANDYCAFPANVICNNVMPKLTHVYQMNVTKMPMSHLYYEYSELAVL